MAHAKTVRIHSRKNGFGAYIDNSVPSQAKRVRGPNHSEYRSLPTLSATALRKADMMSLSSLATVSRLLARNPSAKVQRFAET
jgi:hypothetical protein